VRAVARQLSPTRPSRPVDILIIGSDRRVGQPSLGARSDTLLLVRLDPDTDRISMLSVPRDLQVEIPGYGLGKINDAYSLGGARLTVATVKRLLHVPINDFIDVNFVGFVRVVDRLGGAYLTVDHRYYNDTAVTNFSSIDLQPGYQRLNGRQALSFVRFRHDQNGDFTRIERQQQFLREMKRVLAGSASLSHARRLLSVASIMSHYVVSDIASVKRIYTLVSLALRLDTNHIYQTHVFGATPTIGGVSYVVATPGEVQRAVHRFLHPRPTPVRHRAPIPRQKAARVSPTPSAGTATTVSGLSSAAGSAGRSRAPVDAVQWQALRRQTPLRLYAPTVVPAGLAYDQLRAYRIPTGHGRAPAAVAVGTTPAGGYWNIQAVRWTDPPILADADATRMVAGRQLELFYDGPRLHLVAWRIGRTAYWVANTLGDELSNAQMLRLAASAVPVR